MNAGCHRICCTARNAFRPGYALSSVFLDNIAIRFASRLKPSTEIEINEPEFVPPAELSYIDTSSLKNTLANLRAQNRKTGNANDVAQDDQRAQDERCFTPIRSEGHNLSHDGKKPARELRYPQSRTNHSFRPGSTTNPTQQAQSQETTFDSDVAGPAAGKISSKKLGNIAAKKKQSLSEEVLEYEGRYVKPIKDIFVDARSLPWVKNLNFGDGTPRLSKLGAEVASFAKWIRPKDAELAAKEAAIKETITIINALLPEYKTEVFGSSRNGLGLASSDIDIRIYKDEPAPPENWMGQHQSYLPPTAVLRKQNLRALNRLHMYFDHIHDYIMCNVRYARYPLLNMQHKQSGIDVQVVCANSTEKQRQRIEMHLTQNPHYFDLYAVIKTLLDVRGLTDVFRGGLGSYNILIMIIAALKMPDKFFNSSRNPVLEPQDSLGELGRELMKVLSFYGSWLDTYNRSVHVEPFKVAHKIDLLDLSEKGASTTLAGEELRLIDHSQPYLLCLEDPEDPTNDLGRQAFGWKHIQATLNQCNRKMLWTLKDAPEGRSLTSYALGAAVPTYLQRRQLADEYGQLVLENPEMLHFEAPNPRFVRPVRNSGKRGRFAKV